MAQRVIIEDDLDGSVGAETVRYSFDGQDYEIDLSEENVKRLRDALQPFINKSRIVEPTPSAPHISGRRHRRSSPSGRSKDELQNIRKWAQDTGYNVAPRGRIKRDIIEAYDEAQTGTA